MSYHLHFYYLTLSALNVILSCQLRRCYLSLVTFYYLYYYILLLPFAITICHLLLCLLLLGVSTFTVTTCHFHGYYFELPLSLLPLLFCHSLFITVSCHHYCYYFKLTTALLLLSFHSSLPYVTLIAMTLSFHPTVTTFHLPVFITLSFCLQSYCQMSLSLL